MTHEQIKSTLSGLMRTAFEDRMKELQEIKTKIGDWKPGQPDGPYPEGIDDASMWGYFEGYGDDFFRIYDQVYEIDDVSRQFLTELVAVGYRSVEKMLNVKLEF